MSGKVEKFSSGAPEATKVVCGMFTVNVGIGCTFFHIENDKIENDKKPIY